jgi:hypothetical protein
MIEVNLTARLPIKIENFILEKMAPNSWNSTKEELLKKVLENMLVETLDDIEDYFDAEKSYQDYLDSWCESISWEELKKECNL